MRSLSARVKRIEARSVARGPCELCGGKKWVSIVMGEDQEPRPPCVRCGNPPLVVRIVRGEPPPGWREDPGDSP